MPLIDCNHTIHSTTTVVRLAVLMTYSTSSLVLSLIKKVLHCGTLDTYFWILPRLVEHHGVIVLLNWWLASIVIINWNRLSIVALRCGRLELLSCVIRVGIPGVLIEIETCFSKAHLLPYLTLDWDLSFRRLVIRIKVSKVCLCEHVCISLRHLLLGW